MAEGPYRSVIDDWCPPVNLFEDEQAAPVWARQRRISGAVRPVAQATQLARRCLAGPPVAGGHARRLPRSGWPVDPGAEEGVNADQD